MAARLGPAEQEKLREVMEACAMQKETTALRLMQLAREQPAWETVALELLHADLRDQRRDLPLDDADMSDRFLRNCESLGGGNRSCETWKQPWSA